MIILELTRNETRINRQISWNVKCPPWTWETCPEQCSQRYHQNQEVWAYHSYSGCTPISFRIDFKIPFLVLKSLHGDGPPYLSEWISPLESPCSLRSNSRSLLAVPRTRLCIVGDLAFCSIAPRNGIACLITYSHGQKYWHPCTYVR